MKKKIISIVILGMYLFCGSAVMAAEDFDESKGVDKAVYDNAIADWKSPAEASAAAGWYKPPVDGNSSWWPTTVTVTEKMPWMSDCVGADNQPITTRKFKCTIKPGFGSVMEFLQGFIKYVTFITALVGILMLVVSWVQYSLAGADKSAADDAKKRIEKVIAGIVLLFLIAFILNTVAPWVYSS